MNAEDRIARARVQLVMHHPFFAYHALSMPVKEMPSIPTMATDSINMFFNRDFVERNTDTHLLAVVAHEVLHKTNGHHLRRGDRDTYHWNIACDLAINPALVLAGFDLPDGALLDSKYDLEWSAERIYADRESNGEHSKKRKPGTDPGGMGEVMDQKNPDGSNMTPGEKQAAAADLSLDIAQSVMAARASKGDKSTTDWHHKQIMAHNVNWRDVLNRYIKVSVTGDTTDYSMSRPSRKWIHDGIYMPGPIKSSYRDVVVVIDSSPSVVDGMVNRFMAEINGAASECLPENLHVICCSDVVHSHETFQFGDVASVKIERGSGTDFRPAFDLVESLGIQPSCLIYLTDTEGDFPDKEPSYPVLWATEKRNAHVPWGEIINIDIAVNP